MAGPSQNDRFLKTVYQVRDPDEVRDMYDRWAASYDTELIEENGYAQPRRCAEMLSRHLPDRTAEILDIGCGTGLSGAALAEAGYGVVDGCDFSAAMLEKARGTGPLPPAVRRGSECAAPGCGRRRLRRCRCRRGLRLRPCAAGFSGRDPAGHIARRAARHRPERAFLRRRLPDPRNWRPLGAAGRIDRLAEEAWRPYPGHRRDRLGHRRAQGGRTELNESASARHPPCGGSAGAARQKLFSFFTINFLDTASRTPYIGPVNARSAPAAAGRRPKRSERRNRREPSRFPARRRRSAIRSPIQCAALCAALCAGGA